LKIKLKLEELLGGRKVDSDNESVVAPLEMNSLQSSDRKQVINFEMKIKE
jgi:hypothetical protein